MSFVPTIQLHGYLGKSNLLLFLWINFASVRFKLLFASLICELLFKYRKWFGVCWENTRSNILCFYRVFAKLARSWLRCDKCPLLFVQFLHISISKGSRILQTIPARISLFFPPNALNAGEGVKQVPKTSEAGQVIFLEKVKEQFQRILTICISIQTILLIVYT